ncbi:MAG TPA: hypothetical protein VN255_15030 [Mycobacterium sp.]|nr:hypothetical protein [Mycobacterium sp.]
MRLLEAVLTAASISEFAVLQRPYQGPPILEEDPADVPPRQMPHLRENDLGRLWRARGGGPPDGAGIAVVSRSSEGIPRTLVAALSDLIGNPGPGISHVSERCQPQIVAW